MSEWEKVLPMINETIKSLHSRRETWASIATALNKKGTKTKTGIKWSGQSANAHALGTGVVTRRVSTVNGAAGTTVAQVPLKRNYTRQVSSKKMGVSNAEVEEIMTSNLETGLKLKVIKMIAVMA